MSNSKLVNYTKISPNRNVGRNHKIDTISIHCMAGNLTIERCGDLFASSSREASSNYGVGSDGRIGMYVEEKDRSWCTSSSSNDNRAITIEVANDTLAPNYHVSTKAMNALINLLVDICKRNDIKELKWQADKSLIGQVDKQNMTVHRWFASKSCPGPYLYSMHSYIANKVNKKLGIVPAVAGATVKEGSNGANSLNLQKDLNYLGFKGKDNLVLITDGDFGANSVYALKAFQKKYGLTVNGIYDAKNVAKMKTLIKPAATSPTKPTVKAPTIASPVVKNGTIGTQAKYLQQDLNFLGFKGKDGKTLTVDGNFGINSVYALKMFQKKYNLTQDGIYGSASYNKMKSVCK